MVWRLGLRDAIPLEEWVTRGDDDVRRVDRCGETGANPDGESDANPDGESFVRESPSPAYAICP